MKFSIRLNNDLPVQQYITIAQVAEEAGLDQIWVSNDLFLQSAIVILTAIAYHTKHIELGSCILNPYTINPVEIAMMAYSLDEVSNGRFNLGLSSGAAEFLNWVGITLERPRTAVVESIQVIKRLLSGERASLDGKFLKWTNDAYLRMKPQRSVPIYVGAMSPKMLQEIGKIADGGLPLLFPPEHYENVKPLIQQGAESVGRNLDEIDIAACIWCSIGEDRIEAESVLKEKIAYYGQSMSPLILQQLGLKREDFNEIERIVMKENNLAKARDLVTNSMLRIGIAGTTSNLIARLEQLTEMGVRHLSFGPPLGPDPIQAVQAIGRDVIPHFAD